MAILSCSNHLRRMMMMMKLRRLMRMLSSWQKENWRCLSTSNTSDLVHPPSYSFFWFLSSLLGRWPAVEQISGLHIGNTEHFLPLWPVSYWGNLNAQWRVKLQYQHSYGLNLSLYIHRYTIKMYGIRSELHAKYKVCLFRQEFISVHEVYAI
jgi:hypothetical protein